MAIDKILGNGDLDKVADSVFSAVSNSVSEVKAMQQRKAAENVQIVIQALKKIESNLQDKYDGVTTVIEKRVASIKNGKDGQNGVNGKDGRDGRPGRDGAAGPKGNDGLPGRNGIDGVDGVSVTNAFIDFDGSLIINLSNGQDLNVGEVVAPDLAEKIQVITNGGGTSQQVLDTLVSLQNQINNLIPSQTGNAGKFLTTDGTDVSWSPVAGALDFQGTWNASTNTPTLASGVGVSGEYYITDTAGSTNLDGITDWQIGDWLLFNGNVWQKLDQSNLVTSVNGQTGAISLTTTDINEGTNLYYTDARSRGAISAGTAISYDAATGVVTNAAPDQAVSLTGSGATTVTGTYPNFTISSTGGGTVTSVAATAGTGISVSGSPITTSGTLTITNTAPDQTVVLTGAGTTSVSGTYPNFTITSADSTLGTVTSVGGTGTVSGIALSGTVTSSGNLTLGGTLDLSSPPTIGNTAPNAATFTTVNAATFDTNVAAAGVTLSGTTLAADGTDTNIDVIVNPKGTGGLGVGGNTTGVVAGNTITSKFCVKHEGPNQAGGFVHVNNTTAASGAGIFACRSRGTLESPTIVQNNDSLATITFAGNDGVDLALAARISVEVDGTPGSNDMPGRMVFLTTPDGSQTPTEALRIDSAQNVKMSKADIDGGTIDGTTIGGSSAAAATVTTLTATTGNFSGNVTLDGPVQGNVVAVAALDIDCSLGNYFTKTIAGNSTFTFSNAPASASFAFTLELTHTSGAVTWPTEVKFPGDTAPTITDGNTSLFIFVTDDGGTRWRGAALVDYVN